jgi:hypothetical protein
MAKSPAPLQERLVKREPPKIGRERFQAAQGEEVDGFPPPRLLVNLPGGQADPGEGSVQGLVVDVQFGRRRGEPEAALGAEESGNVLCHLEVASLAPADEVQDHGSRPLGGKAATHELFKLCQSRMTIIQEFPPLPAYYLTR